MTCAALEINEIENVLHNMIQKDTRLGNYNDVRMTCEHLSCLYTLTGA